MKTTLYLVRHGYSEGNLYDLFIGHGNVDLTDLGRRQAEMAADYLKDIPVDAIYSSDLDRAYHTACATAKPKGMQIQKSAQLREIMAGQWEGMVFSQIRETYPEEFRIWCEDFSNAVCPGGESVRQMQKRFVDEVRRIAEAHPGQSVMIFAHATVLRAFCAYCKKAEGAAFQAIGYPSNASLSIATYEDGEFSMVDYSIDHYMGELITALPEDV